MPGLHTARDGQLVERLVVDREPLIQRRPGRGHADMFSIDKAEKWPAVLDRTYHTNLEYEFYPSFFAIEIGIVTYPAAGRIPFGTTPVVVPLSPYRGPTLSPGPRRA